MQRHNSNFTDSGRHKARESMGVWRSGGLQPASRTWLLLAVVSAAVLGHMPSATAQSNAALPGGAIGSDVFCLQAGSLGSGVFAATYLQTGTGTWEERSNAGVFKFKEKARDDFVLELVDAKRSVEVQIDFVAHTILEKSAKAGWADRYMILNANTKETSTDCLAVAERSAKADAKDDKADTSAVDSEDAPKSATKPSEKSSKAEPAPSKAEPASSKAEPAAPKAQPAAKPTAKKKSTSEQSSKKPVKKKKKVSAKSSSGSKTGKNCVKLFNGPIGVQVCN